jgi:hypothetical protein
MPPQTISLTLDEILALLQLMSSRPLTGLEEIVADMDEQHLTLRVQKGVEVLVNRGALTIRSSDDIVLDELLLGLVGSCALPDATLMLGFESPEQTVRHFFHVTPFLMVEQAPPDGEIFRFTHLPTPAALQTRAETLLAHLHVSRRPPASVERLVAESVLAVALRHIRRGAVAEATSALVDDGWATVEAEAFCGDCSGATWWHSVAAWGLRRPERLGDAAATVVSGAQSLWLLARHPERRELVRVGGASGVACTAALLAPIMPVIGTFQADRDEV